MMQVKHTTSQIRLFAPSAAPTVTAAGIIRGYVAIWGSPEHRDAYNTWFDRANPPSMALDFLPVPLCLEHGEGEAGKDIIGSVNKVWFDQTGIAFEGRVDRAYPLFGAVIDKIQRALYKTSSGSVPHLVEFDDDGRFVKWPLAELSLTEYPAEDMMPSVTLIRSHFGESYESSAEGAGGSTGEREQARSTTDSHRTMTMPTLAELVQSGNATPEQLIEALLQEPGMTPEKLMQAIGAGNPPSAMSEPSAPAQAPAAAGIQPNAPAIPAPAQPSNNDVLAQIQALLAGRSAPQTPAPAPTALTAQALTEVLRAAFNPPAAQPPTTATPNNPIRSGGQTPGYVNVQVTDPYAHLTPEVMALGYELADAVRGHHKIDLQLSDAYKRAMAEKAMRAKDQGSKAMNDWTVTRSLPWKRADEVMQTAPSGTPDEWVKDYNGTSLWESLRADVKLIDLMKKKGMDEGEIPQGFKGETIPLEGTDPTWYNAPEATDLNAASGMITPTFSSSKYGTGEKSVSVGKLSAAITFSREWQEDNLIAALPEIQRKIRVTGAEQLETILLLGDTATGANVNINLIDSTPAAQPAKPAYTVLNGLFKLPLVTYTNGTLDCLNTMSETLFLQILALMPAKSRNKEKLLYVIDSDSMLVALNIPSVKTKDVNSAATVENGVITRMWGVDLHELPLLTLANTAGKISNTGSNNVRGRGLLIRPDQWVWRWKRRMMTDVVYQGFGDAYLVTAHMRFGVAYRDTDAAKAFVNMKATL